MAKSTVRVIIPKNPGLFLTLASDVYTKHTDDGASSPLAGLEDNNWTDNGPKIAQAKGLQTQIGTLEKALENLYGQRDLLIAPVLATVKSSRDLLLSKFSKNPKKLGDWGFTVDDSPKPPKKSPA